MKALLQRVDQAKVLVNQETVGEIASGLLVFLGITHTDSQKQVDWLVNKLLNLRIFPDDASKMNLSVKDIKGSILVVSQFTLYGSCEKGRRPEFLSAADPSHAKPLYESFISTIKSEGLPVASGSFGASMEVHLVNNGPVTLMLETPQT